MSKALTTLVMFCVLNYSRDDGLFFFENVFKLFITTLCNAGTINTAGHIKVLELGCCGSLTLECLCWV
jgi:heme/copper-type cytochrome/quinol oxidase subunit 4